MHFRLLVTRRTSLGCAPFSCSWNRRRSPARSRGPCSLTLPGARPLTAAWLRLLDCFTLSRTSLVKVCCFQNSQFHQLLLDFLLKSRLGSNLDWVSAKSQEKLLEMNVLEWKKLSSVEHPFFWHQHSYVWDTIQAEKSTHSSNYNVLSVGWYLSW